LGRAEARAKHHFHNKVDCYRLERVAIAKIDITNLSRVIYRRLCSVPQTPIEQIFDDLPILIDLTKFPSRPETISMDAFTKYEPEIWLSMKDVRTHFNVSSGMGHNDEWLACGFIALSRVARILPCSGEEFPAKAKVDVICNGYVFNFQHRMCKLRHFWQ
jgi:hypothetical protein